MDAVLKNHVLNLNKIYEKMKDKPKRYKLYNFFKGHKDTLTHQELVEVKKIVQIEHVRFIKSLDKEILKIQKNTK